jgi:hypothetical protein
MVVPARRSWIDALSYPWEILEMNKKNPVSKMAFRGKSLNQMRGSLNLWDFPACDWISALENGMISVAGMSQSRWHLWRFIPLTLHGYATRPWNLRKLYSTLQFQYIQYVLYWFVVLYHNPTLAESASIMCSESAWDYGPPTHIGREAVWLQCAIGLVTVSRCL